MSTTKDRATHCFCCRPGCSRDTPCFACTEGLRQQDDPHFFERDHGGFLPTPDPPREEQRAPLLSDEQMRQLSFRSVNECDMNAVRNWYEAKITGGELMVVKTAKVDASIPGFVQCSCGVDVRTDEWEKWNFCPGCGAKITQ